jgi:endonuclease G
LLKPGEELNTGVLEKTLRQKFESFAAPGPNESAINVANGESIGQALFRRVPVAYSKLVETKDLPAPGPEVTDKDPRVIAISDRAPSERRIGPNNLLPVRFLQAGSNASRSVARVAIKFGALPEAGLGTGFMVARSIFMTNNHVIPNKDIARKLVLQFNYQYGLDGETLLPAVTYELDPDGCFHTDKLGTGLDFTIIGVKPRQVTDSASGMVSTSQAGAEFGYIPLGTSFFYSKGQYANVIQHPQGRPKEVAVHANEVVSIHENVIRYLADTEPGSSGSPVFDNSFVLIGLHHSAGSQDTDGKWLDNEGIRIDKIIDKIRSMPDVKPATLAELSLPSP